jgi:hypothetical protein
MQRYAELHLSFDLNAKRVILKPNIGFRLGDVERVEKLHR